MWPFRKQAEPTRSIPECAFRSEYLTIAEKLVYLRKNASARSVFGAESHRFELNPPLSESAIVEFETTHGIRLPEDYRGFLRYLGNGGAGPFYGVFKLGCVDDGHSTSGWRKHDGLVGALDEPFPHSDAWNDLEGRPEIDGDYQSSKEEDAAFARLDAWESEHYWNSKQVQGALPICHEGCALRDWLVVTGSEAGHVWKDYRADERGLFPVQTATKKRVRFIDWYLDWLGGTSANSV